MSTAEQKIRQRLSGDPYENPFFQHEGPGVVRWITGGIAPDAYVTLRDDNSEIVAHCPICDQEMGRFDASYGPGTYKQVEIFRAAAYLHHQERHS